MESMTTRRSTLVLLFLLFIGIAIALTVFLTQQRQEIRHEAAANSSLSLVAGSSSVNSGDNIIFNVNLSTGTDLVTAATLDINYDPMYLEATDVVPVTGGPFSITFNDKLIDKNNGIVHLSLGYDYNNTAAGFTGSDTAIAHVTFKAINDTAATTVGFTNNTHLATAINPNIYLEANLAAGSVEVINANQSVADSIVSVSTNASSYQVGDIVTTTVSLDPGVNLVTGADITIDFNRDVLEGQSGSVAIDNKFSYCQSSGQGTFSNGQIRMQLCIADIQNPIIEPTTLFTFTFIALSDATTSISINNVSLVSGTGSSANMIKNKQNATITIGSNNNNDNNNNSGGSCANTRPVAPTNLNASLVNKNQVKLTWNTVSANVTHYGIKYGIKSGNYLYGAVNIGNTNNFTVSGLTQDYTYYFVVFAVNDCIAGNDSNEAKINLSAGTGGSGVFSPKKPSPKPGVTPPPATGFSTLGSATSSATNPFLSGNKPAVSALPKVQIPSKNASISANFLSSPFALYGGIFLIVLALFLSIYFFRMRRF